jgi:hypothetical protein
LQWLVGNIEAVEEAGAEDEEAEAVAVDLILRTLILRSASHVSSPRYRVNTIHRY